MAGSSDPRADAAWSALSAGDAEAPTIFAEAITAAPQNRELLIGEAEALLAADADLPLARLSAAVEANPCWVRGQSALAGLRFETGDPGYDRGFIAAIAAYPHDPALWNAWIALLAGAGEQARAADTARAAQAYFTDPVLRLIEADHAGLAGDVNRAAKLLDAVPHIPGRARIAARQALRLWDLTQAVALLEIARDENPKDLAAWALSELAWRAARDERSEWLSGQPGLVGQMDLDLTATVLEELALLLRRLHRGDGRPLGQSVRGGTQTRGNLFQRREPVLQRLTANIQCALDVYRAALPAVDLSHPFLRYRNASLKAVGGWSIRLTGAGYHVAHIHAAGIVSSACYIVVPPINAAHHEGWLELGCPPDDLKLALEPLGRIEPKPGRLVLFPSFLYHGTRPLSSGERMSVAFDAC